MIRTWHSCTLHLDYFLTHVLEIFQAPGFSLHRVRALFAPSAFCWNVLEWLGYINPAKIKSALSFDPRGFALLSVYLNLPMNFYFMTGRLFVESLPKALDPVVCVNSNYRRVVTGLFLGCDNAQQGPCAEMRWLEVQRNAQSFDWLIQA